jgi:hypothetical protein
MSDAAIDRAYEENLQAVARYLEVWVTYQDGRRVKRRVFLDTPEGRQSAAKNADTWMELPLVTRVDVVPVGAGAERDQTREVRPITEQEPTAPTRVACEYGRRLCKPKVRIQPSGRRLFHSDDCPASPGEQIGARSYAQGRTWPPYGRVLR